MEKMIDLTIDETHSINGGAPAWHWTGNVIGAIADFVEDVFNSYSSTPEGKAVQTALRDFQ